MAGHGVQACSNAGWDDAPEWQLVCECQWETSGHPTEAGARERHTEHLAELVLDGRCGCVNCAQEPAAA